MKIPRSFRVNAVVLRHADWGEADRIITLYTREQGKLRALAKGARKMRSRKAGHLEPFTHITAQLAAAHDMPIITQVETVDAYLPMRDDLVRTGYAAYCAELLDRFTYAEEGTNPAIFQTLTDTLSRISGEADSWVAVRYYEMRLLDFLGFRPQLFHCANCEREIQAEDQYFSFASGGVICPRCGMGLPNLSAVSVDVLKHLRHFQRSNYPVAARANPAESTRRALEALMQGYLQYLLERGLNTPDFLRRVGA